MVFTEPVLAFLCGPAKFTVLDVTSTQLSAQSRCRRLLLLVLGILPTSGGSEHTVDYNGRQLLFFRTWKIPRTQNTRSKEEPLLPQYVTSLAGSTAASGDCTSAIIVAKDQNIALNLPYTTEVRVPETGGSNVVIVETESLLTKWRGRGIALGLSAVPDQSTSSKVKLIYRSRVAQASGRP